MKKNKIDLKYKYKDSIMNALDMEIIIVQQQKEKTQKHSKQTAQQRSFTKLNQSIIVLLYQN